MFVTILGRRWKFLRRRLRGMYGYCDPPAKSGKEIVIHSSLKGMTELDTILHEMLHAAGWHLSEDAVDQMATDMARVLWRDGWRRNGEAPED